MMRRQSARQAGMALDELTCSTEAAERELDRDGGLVDLDHPLRIVHLLDEGQWLSHELLRLDEVALTGSRQGANEERRRAQLGVAGALSGLAGRPSLLDAGIAGPERVGE